MISICKKTIDFVKLVWHLTWGTWYFSLQKIGALKLTVWRWWGTTSHTKMNALNHAHRTR